MTKTKQELKKEILQVLINQNKYDYVVLNVSGNSISVNNEIKPIFNFSAYDSIEIWENKLEELKQLIEQTATK